MKYLIIILALATRLVWSHQSDLTFIQLTLQEDHPGAYNALDPDFLNNLKNNASIAQHQLLHVSTDKEKTCILEEFGRTFHDAHLWVHYDRSMLEVSERPPRSYSVQKVHEHLFWIHIPTFHPQADQMDALHQIILSLPLLRQHTLVLDLRGNGGGNSCWGEELLKALFGEGYAKEHLSEYRRNEYIEWRASHGNAEHVKDLISKVRKEFGAEHPIVRGMQQTYEGMQKAISHGENYYRESAEHAVFPHATPLFKGRVIAIIDKGCGSACLDFLDGLKAMDAGVIFIGQPTSADTVYMELRKVTLPSGKGTLGFPIKVVRNRPRGHNEPHIPDIRYQGNMEDTAALQAFILALK
jgi:hypothetical protein